MTGRDLILYILANGLEDKPVFENGRFIGFLTPLETAAKMNVGMASIIALVNEKKIPGYIVRQGLYIPASFERGKTDAQVRGDCKDVRSCT